MSVNATSSIERFFIGAGDSRAFVNTDPGSNLWDIDVNGELVQGMDGVVAASNTAVVKLQSSEDVAAVAAAKTYGTTNTITLTAVTAGAAGNSITAQFIDPGENNAALRVVVVGTVVLVYYATGGTGTITSLPAQVKAAINSVPAAAALVVATHAGTAAMAAIAIAPLTGGSNAAAPTTWSDVATVTVVSNGYAILTGATGKYARILNVSGGGIAHIVAKPHRRIQPLVALGK